MLKRFPVRDPVPDGTARASAFEIGSHFETRHDPPPCVAHTQSFYPGKAGGGVSPVSPRPLVSTTGASIFAPLLRPAGVGLLGLLAADVAVAVEVQLLEVLRGTEELLARH